MKRRTPWAVVVIGLLGCAHAPVPSEEEIEADLAQAAAAILHPSHPPSEHLIYVTVPADRMSGVIDAVRPCAAPEAAVTKVDRSRSRLLFRIPIAQHERALCIRRLARPFGLVVADSR